MQTQVWQRIDGRWGHHRGARDPAHTGVRPVDLAQRRRPVPAGRVGGAARRTHGRGEGPLRDRGLPHRRRQSDLPRRGAPPRRSLLPRSRTCCAPGRRCAGSPAPMSSRTRSRATTCTTAPRPRRGRRCAARRLSSGPAAAVALGHADVGLLATDTAGSLRVPASYQGLWACARPTTSSASGDAAARAVVRQPSAGSPATARLCSAWPTGCPQLRRVRLDRERLRSLRRRPPVRASSSPKRSSTASTRHPRAVFSRFARRARGIRGSSLSAGRRCGRRGCHVHRVPHGAGGRPGATTASGCARIPGPWAPRSPSASPPHRGSPPPTKPPPAATSSRSPRTWPSSSTRRRADLSDGSRSRAAADRGRGCRPLRDPAYDRPRRGGGLPAISVPLLTVGGAPVGVCLVSPPAPTSRWSASRGGWPRWSGRGSADDPRRGVGGRPPCETPDIQPRAVGGRCRRGIRRRCFSGVSPAPPRGPLHASRRASTHDGAAVDAGRNS